MTRKAFIESHGATCSNWTWSWSFVNHEQRFVIFGAWEQYRETHGHKIFSHDWETSHVSNMRNPANSQSLEHIRLVEQEGYALKTFPMIMKTSPPTNGARNPRKSTTSFPASRVANWLGLGQISSYAEGIEDITARHSHPMQVNPQRFHLLLKLYIQTTFFATATRAKSTRQNPPRCKIL